MYNLTKILIKFQKCHISDQLEFYSNQQYKFESQGFDLQIISSCNIDNIKINNLAINDDSLSIICENYQTTSDEIKVPFNRKQLLKLQKNENIYLKLSSITDSQVVFQTQQKALCLCLVFNDEDKITNNQTIITTTLKDNMLEFYVENIEDSIILPVENQILSFFDEYLLNL